MEKVCSKCGVSKPHSAFNKKKDSKGGFRPNCKQCEAEYRKQNKERIAEYRKQNKERITKYEAEYRKQNKERIAEYRKQNKERLAKYKADYRKQNKERIAEYRAEYYKQNKERIAEHCAEYRNQNKERMVEYRKQNKDRISERNVRRQRGLRAQKIAKTYAKQNAAVYAWANDCRQLTGVEFHVDHICPAKAQVYDPQFCTYLPATGLHVPWNLDPKPASQNSRKGNRVTLDEILHTPTFSFR